MLSFSILDENQRSVILVIMAFGEYFHQRRIGDSIEPGARMCNHHEKLFKVSFFIEHNVFVSIADSMEHKMMAARNVTT